jgi:DNA-binding transcriptional LysR family regulator
MNFKQLEYFSAVAEAKSISKAARILHIAQPPLSRQISMLEDELGVCLFLRTNKGVELTEAGRSLYQQSQHLFQNFRAMVDSVRDINTGLRGVLKIGTIYSDTHIVLDKLQTYHEQYPQVELYIRLGAPKDLLEDLNKGELHVLFLRSATDTLSSHYEKLLGEDPLELVMRADLDPEPEQEVISLQALEGKPLCLLRSDDLWGYSSQLINECQRRGIEPNIVCQCYDAPMAVEMVRAGFGISYLPHSVVATHPDSNIYTKPVQGLSVKSYPMMVWSGDLYYASCVKHFLAMFDDPER